MIRINSLFLLQKHLIRDICFFKKEWCTCILRPIKTCFRSCWLPQWVYFPCYRPFRPDWENPDSSLFLQNQYIRDQTTPQVHTGHIRSYTQKIAIVKSQRKLSCMYKTEDTFDQVAILKNTSLGEDFKIYASIYFESIFF